MFRVNAVTGEVCASAVDLMLPGFLSLEFERKYRSLSDHHGVLGANWLSILDQSLRVGDDEFVYRDSTGRETRLEPLPREMWPAVAASGSIVLTRRDDGFVLEASSLRLYFAPSDFAAASVLIPEWIVDAHGHRIHLAGHDGGLPPRIVDSCGRELVLQYDSHGRLIELALVDRPGARPRQHARYSYSHEGDLESVWTPAGEWKYRYADHLIVEWRSPWNELGYAAYDAQRRCVHLTREGGFQERTIDYDDRRFTSRVTNSLGYSTVYRCTENWVIKEIIDPLGAIETRVLDERGQVLGTVNPLGLTALTMVEPTAGVLRVVDAAGATTVFMDDERGQLRKQIDACGHTWEWDYDETGNLVAMRSPSGAQSRLTYTDGFLSEIGDLSGRRIRQRRSPDGRQFSVEDDAGPVAAYEYDELGNLSAAYSGTDQARRVERDHAGRVIRELWPDGSIVRTEYGVEGEPIRITDQQGRTTSFEYDVHALCRRVRWPSGAVVTYEYDLEGNAVAVVNERGERHEYRYDAAGRVMAQTFVDGRIERYAYDARGRLTRIDYEEDQADVLTRNAVGKIATKHYRDGLVETFGYDELRRLVNAESPTGRVSLVWDGDGNLVHQSQVHGTIDYTYLPGGNRRALTTDAGRRIVYSYDVRNRVSQIDDSATGIYRFDYDATDRLVARTYPNGALFRIAYDVRGRVSAETLSLGDRTLLSLAYEFDSVDRLTAVQGNGQRIRAAYDARDRTIEYGDERYRYDETGNLTFSTESGEHTYERDRLLAGPGFECEYDIAGALVLQTGHDGRRFEYDGAGRLSSIALPDGSTAKYRYDALGRRTSKSIGRAQVCFLWDGFSLLGETTSESAIDYLSFPTFLPLARKVNDTVEFFVTDRRGCVVATMSQSAELRTFHYSAFGRLRPDSDASAAPPFRLRGQYFDRESGLHYSLHRYYDADTARFLTPDPIGIEGGRNVYHYPANPLTWEDPFGLAGECQGDVFYRAMSKKEKDKVMADCQLHAKNSKCPEGPYVTQTRAYCESALKEKPEDYQHLVEICTKSGTADRLTSSPFARRNGSQPQFFPDLPDVVSGKPDRIEHKMERVGRPDEALNYGLSKGEGLKQFNSEVESMKVVDSGETCTPGT